MVSDHGHLLHGRIQQKPMHVQGSSCTTVRWSATNSPGPFMTTIIQCFAGQLSSWSSEKALESHCLFTLSSGQLTCKSLYYRWKFLLDKYFPKPNYLCIAKIVSKLNFHLCSKGRLPYPLCNHLNRTKSLRITFCQRSLPLGVGKLYWHNFENYTGGGRNFHLRGLSISIRACQNFRTTPT